MQNVMHNTALQAPNPITHPIRALWRRWESYRLRSKTVAALSVLSDSQLRDVGLDNVGRDWSPRSSDLWARRGEI